MANRIKKYNPAFLPEEELVESFVVRHAELNLIVQIIRENVTGSNQHVLIIGPCGIGKTMLVLRAVEEVRREKDLNERWYPLVFAEESYEVSTPGEFWLEALFHLGQKTGETCWKQTYRELSSEQNEERLEERALAQLMDFADNQGKRILLVVENLNMLVGEQISDSDAWKLRHTLLHEPRVMLLATATSRFEEIDNTDKAMFELFKLYNLKPLEEDECRILWTWITGKEPTDERVRPLQILTGGSPRLLVIVSTFAARMSLKELMDDLMQLVDDHTEYFRNNLRNLPPVERKVYVALAELWDPATAREVADVARLNVNKTSSLLRRLMERGAVILADGRKRTKLYQVAERMYNIYYLMRRRGAPSGRIKAFVNFMVSFYGQEELVKLTQRIAEEACKLKPEFRKDHFWAYEEMLKSTSTQSMREKLIKAAPQDFFKMTDIPASIKKLVEPEKPKDLREAEADEDLLKLLKQTEDLKKEGKLEEAERVYREAIKIAPQSAKAWTKLGDFLCDNLKKYEEAEEAFRKAIKLDEKYAMAWASLGFLLHANLERYEEAEQACRKAIELDEKYAFAWASLGVLFHDKFERYDEAEQAYRKAIEIKPEVAFWYAKLGQLLHEKLERYDEAEKEYRKAIERDEKNAWPWAQLGKLLEENLERYDEAEKAYRKVIGIKPEVAFGYAKLGQLLHEKMEHYDEAEKAYRKAIKIKPEEASGHAQLGQLLHEKLERYDEAEKEYRKAIELEPDNHWVWEQLGLLLHKNLGRFDEAEKAYQKAVELEPHCCTVWVYLGELMHQHLERYAEAEEAYRKAIDLRPDYAIAWARLGQLLHRELERYEEAEDAYTKAIEIEPEVAWRYAKLGQLLQEKLDRYEEAERAYRKAIELKPDDAWAWTHLAILLHTDLGRPDEAEKAYRKAIKIDAKFPCPWVYLGELLQERKCYEESERTYRKAIENGADCVYSWEKYGNLLHKKLRRYEEAEMAYRKAIELKPKNLRSLKNLIVLLQKELKRPDEALELVGMYLEKTDLVEKGVNDAIDMFVGLAAGGYGHETLKILRESPSAKILEPLVVRLQLFVSEDVKAAAEIMEVARDVVKRIEERRDKMQPKARVKRRAKHKRKPAE